MHKAINEPGLWMMVFGTIIIAMFLFAGEGNCQDTEMGLQYLVKSINHTEGYGFGIGGASHSNTKRWTEYLHFVGPRGGPYTLMMTTRAIPTTKTAIECILQYMMRIKHGQ